MAKLIAQSFHPFSIFIQLNVSSSHDILIYPLIWENEYNFRSSKIKQEIQ